MISSLGILVQFLMNHFPSEHDAFDGQISPLHLSLNSDMVKRIMFGVPSFSERNTWLPC